MEKVYENKNRYTWVYQQGESFFLYFINDRFIENAIELNQREKDLLWENEGEFQNLVEQFCKDFSLFKDRTIKCDRFRKLK